MSFYVCLSCYVILCLCLFMSRFPYDQVQERHVALQEARVWRTGRMWLLYNSVAGAALLFTPSEQVDLPPQPPCGSQQTAGSPHPAPVQIRCQNVSKKIKGIMLYPNNDHYQAMDGGRGHATADTSRRKETCAGNPCRHHRPCIRTGAETHWLTAPVEQGHGES